MPREVDMAEFVSDYMQLEPVRDGTYKLVSPHNLNEQIAISYLEAIEQAPMDDQEDEQREIVRVAKQIEYYTEISAEQEPYASLEEIIGKRAAGRSS